MTVVSETPGRTPRFAWRRLAAAAAVVAWVVIAAVLLRTTVPRSLELPAVDVRKTFGAGVVDEARHFERVLILIWVASEIALLGALWLYAKRGVVFLRESVAGPIGSGMLLGMLGLALTWAVQKPFGLVELWWSRRHGVSQMAYWEWLVGAPLELAVSFAFICLALLVVM